MRDGGKACLREGKNASIRYLILDKCLSSQHRKYYIKDLIDEVDQVLKEENGPESGVGRTQIYKDLKFLKNGVYQAPIEKVRDGRHMTYKYSDKDYSIRNNPLTKPETDTILDALMLFNRVKGMAQFEWLNDMLPILFDKLGGHTASAPVILLDHNIDYSGSEHIDVLYKAIIGEKVVTITNREFNELEDKEYVFHPSVLKQFNNRWFVFGKNEESEKPTWNFALDRVSKIEIIPGKAYKKIDIDWEEDYFYDLVGVTRFVESSLETIKLKVSKLQYKYMRTKPLHPTQKADENIYDDHVLVSIEVYPNYELKQLILSFGDQVEVLEPKHLRKDIGGMVNRLNKRYQD